MASSVTRCCRAAASVAEMAKPEPDLPEASLVRLEQRLPAASLHFVRDRVGRSVRLEGLIALTWLNQPIGEFTHAPSLHLSGSQPRSRNPTGRSPGTQRLWRSPQRSRAVAELSTRPDLDCSECYPE